MDTWKILDTGNTCVGLVECSSSVPDTHELLIPLPSLGLARGDVIVQEIGLGRVEAEHVPFDTREKLHALRDAFGGRKWIMETFPLLTDRCPNPVPTPDSRVSLRQVEKWNWYHHRFNPNCLLSKFLYDARRWSRGDLHRVVVITAGRTGRVSAQVEAEDDAAAIEALLSSVAEPEGV